MGKVSQAKVGEPPPVAFVAFVPTQTSEPASRLSIGPKKI